MASIDKISVREQLNDIKKNVEALKDAGKLSDETSLLFSSLFTLLEIILAVFMEKNTEKTSKNSGIPSSQSDVDESSTQQPKPTQKRPAKDHSFSNRTKAVTVEVLTPKSCNNCQADLTQEPVQRTERRTLIDIRFEKVVHHIDAEEKLCPVCDTLNKLSFPEMYAGPLQYGIGIKAFILDLLVVQMVSLRRVRELMHALCDQNISEATMLKYVSRLYHSLQKWEDEAFAYLQQSPVVNTDETSLKVDKLKHWIHVYASGPVTLKKLHSRRGKEGIKEIGFIPKYTGIIVHDCWASYLLRELTFIIDSNQFRWARHMKRFLKHLCRVVSKKGNKQLTDDEYQRAKDIYRRLLIYGQKEMPPIPPKPKTQRGKVAKSDAHNLLERLEQHQEAVLMFAKKGEVPFTNNRAERDLRMSKVKQKVSGCFREQRYAEAYCRISSYLQTMTAKGYNPLHAIELAITGQLYQLDGGAVTLR